MSTEQEEFNDGDIPPDLGPPRGLKSRKALSSPGLRIGLAVIVVVIVGVGFLALWSGEQKQTPQSTLSPPSSVKGLAGEEGSSPVYIDAVKTKNSERLREALDTGGSAFPTPVAQPQLPPEVNSDKSVELDPVAAFTQAINTPVTPPPAPAPTPVPALPPPPGLQPAYVAPAAEVTALATSMQQQMSTLIAGWTPQPSTVIQVASSGAYAQNNYAANTYTSTPAYGANAPLTEETDKGSHLLIAAGTKIYAQMEMEANSDIPGPVIARILSGPLAGGRALGTFQSTDDYLVMEFNLITRGDKEYTIQAIAIDPQTQLTGLVTDSNQRYFQRIALPGAAAFIRGFARAYADPGSSTTVGDNFATENRRKQNQKEQIAQGVEETANIVSSLFQEQASKVRPLVVVGNGTPIALLFLSAVREEVP